MSAVRQRIGHLGTKSGSHRQRPTEERVDYIEHVFNTYKILTGAPALRGSIAEVGPGDNAGVALLMRKDGCDQVDLIDRFYSERDSELQTRLYEALSSRHNLEEYQLSEPWDEQKLAGIQWTIGIGAEAYFDRIAREKGPAYDYIFSTAVMEHMYDPLGALDSMFACLKPGGKMVHEVDLRDHGMFTPVQPELTFLTIPAPIYRRMTQNSGRPNRILLHRYCETLKAMQRHQSLSYKVLPSALVGVGRVTGRKTFTEIEPDLTDKAISSVDCIRRNLAGEFRAVDSRDLAVAAFHLVIQKEQQNDRRAT